MSHEDKLKTGAADDSYRDGIDRIFGKDHKTQKGRYVQIDGKLVKVDEDYVPPSKNDAPYVISDIEPYKSVATGEYITTRSQHRDMLRRNGLLEVGNEDMSKHIKKDRKPKGIKEAVIRAYEQHRR